jgi:hypothetical protein
VTNRQAPGPLAPAPILDGMEEVRVRVPLAPQIDTLGLSIQTSDVSAVLVPFDDTRRSFAGIMTR